MAQFNFNPTNGLNDQTYFPAAPTSEAAARQQFMTLFNQLKTFLNSGTVEAGTVGGKQATDFLLPATAETTYAKVNHSHNYAAANHGHSEYAAAGHGHGPSSCGFHWGTGYPSNSDGRADGNIYYRIEG